MTDVKRVHQVLKELDLPYEQILARLGFGFNHDPEHLAMDPNGLMSLLKDDAIRVMLWESNIITRYPVVQYDVDRLWLTTSAQRT